MKKIAIVVQRFGPEINGGAELYARMLALHLVKSFEVEVLTTCALDYNTWKNHYPEGLETDGPLKVHRFAVARERIKPVFNFFHTLVNYFSRLDQHGLDWQQVISFPILRPIFWKSLIKLQMLLIYNLLFRSFFERTWMKTQGPSSPGLTDFIRQKHHEYNSIIFINYHYQTTFDNISVAGTKVILVPTAHEEPILYMRLWDHLCQKVRALVFSTEEEKESFFERFPQMRSLPHRVLGIGIERLESKSTPTLERLRGKKFVLYLGRIETNKGCAYLFDYFQEYKESRKPAPLLVLAGREEMEIPKDDQIVSLGFVSVEEKSWLLEHCELLVMPSLYESLSLSVLEAWSKQKPVLVNGNCAVLKGQVKRSNGGIYYYQKKSFFKALDELLKDESLRAKLGKSGYQYYLNHYDWDGIERQWSDIIQNIDAGQETF